MNAIIVPVFRPDKMVARFVRDLLGVENRLVLVDDGSGPGYASFFAALPHEIKVITHAVHRGLGVAVKAALGFVHNSLPECGKVAVVSVPCNKQDVERVCAAAGNNTLALGTSGNTGSVSGLRRAARAVECQLFSLACGKTIRDLRASLRAFSREHIPKFLFVDGDGGDYEVNALLCAARGGMDIVEIPCTGSPQSPKTMGDMRGLYICAVSFLASSLFAFGLEFLLLICIRALLMPLGEEIALLAAVIVSRVLSCVVNYAINKKFVFKSSASLGGSFTRYILVSAIVLVINYGILRFCTIIMRWPLAQSKVIVESILFFVNFALQGLIVYRK